MFSSYCFVSILLTLNLTNVACSPWIYNFQINQSCFSWFGFTFKTDYFRQPSQWDGMFQCYFNWVILKTNICSKNHPAKTIFFKIVFIFTAFIVLFSNWYLSAKCRIFLKNPKHNTWRSSLLFSMPLSCIVESVAKFKAIGSSTSSFHRQVILFG